MSLRARLLLLVLIATLLPAVVGGLLVLDMRRAEIARARQDLVLATRQLAQDLTNTIRSTAQLHYGLSRARALESADRTECSAFLADVLKEHPQYTGILTILPDGRLFCDSLRTGRDLILTDRKYFNAALGPKGPLAVEPVFGRLTGTAVLQIAYAARDEAGRPRFVLLASFNLEKYMRARMAAFPGGERVAAIMDANGMVLTWQPEGDKIRGTTMADSALFRFARDSAGSGVSEGLDTGGVARTWAASSLAEFPDAGLRLLMGVSEKSLLAEANRRLAQALAVVVGVWLIVFAGVWQIAQWGLRRPAERVIDAARRFGGGDYQARVGKPYPRGELGNLMRALDDVFGLVEQQREEIHKLNAGLERRVAERTAQLEVSNQELESFCYSVSHDLRAPLRAMDGYARIFEETYGDRIDDEGRRLLGVVHGEAQRMGQLIDDLLAFSRCGRSAMQQSDVDMNALAREVIAELAPSCPQARIDLDDLPPAHGDRALLRQVWLNLIGNACKYSAMIAEPSIAIGGRTNGMDCEYWVRDNGAGFDMKYAGKLFGVFERLHRQDEFQGTGVGLAIVHRIVSRHGGRVWAEGKVNEGASFYFALPGTPGEKQ